MSFIESETNNQFINTDPAIHQLNNPFPPLNSFSGTGENFTNKLDQVWTAVNTEINDFLQLPDWEVKTRLAITGDWSQTEAKDFFNNISPSQTSVEILPANNMPGIAGGYDAITGKIYLSEDLVKYSDPAKIAQVLIEEIGHKADDILNPGQDSPGDEGEILANLISNQGNIPADWQVLKQENDHKFIQVGDSWIGVEASENIKQEWIQQFGSSSSDSASDIAIDGQGNIYFTGETKGDLGGVNAGSADIWVAKYNTQGEKLWIQQFGGKDWDSATGIQLDEQGNIYLSVYGDLGGVGFNDAWVAKYNTQGEQLWIQQFGTGSDNVASDIAIDGQGNIYLTGNAGFNDAWVAKYNTQGEKLWTQQFDIISSEQNHSSGIELDEQGNIYLTGFVTDNANAYAWVAKYNTQGEKLWTQQFDSGYSDPTWHNDYATGIQLDGQGNIYLSGYGGDDGHFDAWVAKYNTQGEKLWVQPFQPFGGNYAQGIQLDNQGNIYLTGDDWVAKYNAEGQQQLLQQFGSNSIDYSSGITLDTQGNIFLTGYTMGDLGGVNAGKSDTWVAKFTVQQIIIPNIAIQDVAIVEDNAGQKNATFNISLDQTTDQTVSVKYATVNNTAIAGSDFVDQIGQIVLAPGVQTQTISVPIIGDTVVEANETFFVQLSEPNNGVITTAQATGTITNDDQEIIVLPNISIGDVSISEGNSGQKNANFNVTLDKVSETTVTAQYTTVDDTAKADKDFTKKIGQITFNPGVKTQTISVPIIGDKVFEPDEKFSIKLSQATNGKLVDSQAIGTITNDDQKVVVLPNISIQDVSLKEGNSGQTNANFKVTLNQSSNQTVTVQYTTVDDTAKAGKDFTKKTGKLTFKPGVKSQTIAVPIIGDKVFEPDEKFSIKLSQATNGKLVDSQAIGTITNDDQKVVVLPNISIQDVSLKEGNSGQTNANFKVTLNQSSNQTVTVQYTTVDDTAKTGKDFTKKTGKLTFKPGVKSQTIAVPIIGDKILEPKEKFSIKLSQPQNAKIIKAQAIGTIINDDSGDVVLTPNIPAIPLTDEEPDNNSISKKLPTFSKVGVKPRLVKGEIGFGSGSQRDTDDYYRLILDQSENDLYVVLDNLQQDANIEILDQDGSTKLFSSQKTGKTSDTISTILPAGTYYVRVKPQGTNRTPYSLSINI